MEMFSSLFDVFSGEKKDEIFSGINVNIYVYFQHYLILAIIKPVQTLLHAVPPLFIYSNKLKHHA